ncbi:YdcF family protein [Candidatus Dojkabacteria bacterium]|uniref:YdcF family protein n=1 Tax=Candidatus Dojkabacteria bacterium TaxID=2099670 RepID=A0A955RKF3_9BACT|nr:YdcF family protein [Candidatus Dojkabacteria bacterium]
MKDTFFRFKKILVIFLLCSGAILIICTVWWSSFQSQYAKKILTSSEEVEHTKVALVLGTSVQNRKPSYLLSKRIEKSVELYQVGAVEKILMSGDNRTEEYNEPQVMSAAAVVLGVPESDIQPDFAGRSTYESCQRAKEIFDLDEVIIVSQRFHLPRALYLCDKFGVEAVGYVAEGESGFHPYHVREFFATLLAIYEVNFNPREVVGGEKIEI